MTRNIVTKHVVKVRRFVAMAKRGATITEYIRLLGKGRGFGKIIESTKVIVSQLSEVLRAGVYFAWCLIMVYPTWELKKAQKNTNDQSN